MITKGFKEQTPDAQAQGLHLNQAGNYQLLWRYSEFE